MRPLIIGGSGKNTFHGRSHHDHIETKSTEDALFFLNEEWCNAARYKFFWIKMLIQNTRRRAIWPAAACFVSTFLSRKICNAQRYTTPHLEKTKHLLLILFRYDRDGCGHGKCFFQSRRLSKDAQKGPPERPLFIFHFTQRPCLSVQQRFDVVALGHRANRALARRYNIGRRIRKAQHCVQIFLR